MWNSAALSFVCEGLMIFSVLLQYKWDLMYRVESADEISRISE